MKVFLKYLILRLPAVFLLLCIIYACANIGNPNGGPYDNAPPKFVSSKPAVNQLNYKGKNIEVVFDEFISIDNPSENVIVTPPQKQSPIIQAVGKKVSVELKDTLKENTTYTVDFTSSIADNNEKNVLENFSFAFSTGDVLDTMQISGRLLDAAELEPIQKILVGIYDDLSDTAFTRTPFLRTSKTDERGRFVIHNVAPGSYHIFALEDKNRNYAYDKNNDEAMAFIDSVIVPWCERAIVPDSIWKDTIINKIDTVIFDSIAMVEKTLFYPNDLILWYFRDSVTPRQRMLRPERPQDYIFTLKFNAPLDTFPRPVPLNFEPADSDWYITQKGDAKDAFSINYWLLDSMIYKIDTLDIAVTYWKNNDTVPDMLELQTDTFSLVNKETAQRKAKEKKPRKQKLKKKPAGDSISSDSVPPPPPPVPLQMNFSPSGSLNPYDEITLTFGEPVMDVRKEFFKFEIAVDTLWEEVDFEFVADSSRAMTYIIRRPFKYDEKYRLTSDSAAMTGVYGHSNNPTATTFNVKSEKDYGHLTLTLTGLAMDTALVELLNSGGAPVRKAAVENGRAVFRDMPPEKYFVRLIYDANGNGRWDAGSYEERRQPELVVYGTAQYEIRQNWKFDETWDVSKSKIGEKPFDLLKNKPKEETKKKRNYREESKQRSSGGGSSAMPSIGGLGGIMGR